MWTRQAALVTIALLVAAGPAHAAKGDDRLCDQAIALAEARRNGIRTAVRREQKQQSDSYEAASLRIIDGLIKDAGRWRDRRDFPSCVWSAEQAYNFGRVGRPEPPLQSN
jgi:hypothetical protein